MEKCCDSASITVIKYNSRLLMSHSFQLPLWKWLPCWNIKGKLLNRFQPHQVTFSTAWPPKATEHQGPLKMQTTNDKKNNRHTISKQYKYYPPTLIVGLLSKHLLGVTYCMQHIVREAVVKMKLKKENHAIVIWQGLCVCVNINISRNNGMLL